MARMSDTTRLSISVFIGTILVLSIAIQAFDRFRPAVAGGMFAASLLLAVGGPIYLYLRKQRREAYEGVIESKGSEQRSVITDDTVTPTIMYFIVVRLADETRKRAYVSRRHWDEWQVGQAIVKRAGKFGPERA